MTIQTLSLRTLALATTSAAALLLAACSPETEAVAAAPLATAVDPAQSSIQMAADPAALGFDMARFADAKAFLEADIAAGIIPGAVLLVAKGGEVVNLTTVGVEGPGDGDPMSAETIFRIYSMTKPVVSVATMQLVEDGLISLDDPVSRFIPEFANPKVLIGNGETRPAAREVTVRDLITHKAGLIYGVFDPESELGKLYMDAGDVRMDITGLDLAKAIGALPLRFDPGTAWHYSRATDVLGAVIEVASGKSLDVLLDEKIFTPLGMDDTSFYLAPDAFERVAEPPTTIAPLSEVKTAKPMLSGGGGLNSTTEDYFRFVEMLRNKGEYRGVRVLKAETLDEMFRPTLSADVDRQFWFYGPAGDFGLGFGILPVSYADPSIGTQYSWGGYAGTNMWVDPQNDITAVFMIQNNEASARYRPKLNEWIYGVAPPPPPAQ